MKRAWWKSTWFLKWRSGLAFFITSWYNVHCNKNAWFCKDIEMNPKKNNWNVGSLQTIERSKGITDKSGACHKHKIKFQSDLQGNYYTIFDVRERNHWPICIQSMNWTMSQANRIIWIFKKWLCLFGFNGHTELIYSIYMWMTLGARTGAWMIIEAAGGMKNKKTF